MEKKLNLFLSFILLLITSCNKNLPYNTSREYAMQVNFYESLEGYEVIFTLRSQSVKQRDKDIPLDFYVLGKIVDGQFITTSEVLGQGELATKGRKGWLELNSKEFFPEESGRRAQTPFVSGYMTDRGFVPSKREIAISP